MKTAAKVFIILGLVFIIGIINIKSDNHIRVRVIANSNSINDQNIKNDVVEILKKIIDADDSLDIVESKMNVLKKELKYYQEKNNIKIAVELKKTNFPSKRLNSKVIPSGVYETLLITIGSGEGNNYWSILYPEYYGITFEDNSFENLSFKSYFYELFKQ